MIEIDSELKERKREVIIGTPNTANTRTGSSLPITHSLPGQSRTNDGQKLRSRSVVGPRTVGETDRGGERKPGRKRCEVDTRRVPNMTNCPVRQPPQKIVPVPAHTGGSTRRHSDTCGYYPDPCDRSRCESLVAALRSTSAEDLEVILRFPAQHR
ncbi:predicted protein [Histoplasma capsulatum G186AR]|uniref:Uncharacterized protein n=1 Tax=Ajellomyces capsulatus (strain G186AR / H82 / ATCC MYA-2454 / RMSCC 2432) TaxID=447093 RepID=C0NX93_AJECG|nr:uncharacterized protein HCBG_08085 [Histoplasma capsulatum G186AR]EEH03959.1 predicted protein [Histoplasma capsulatum G186AR]